MNWPNLTISYATISPLVVSKVNLYKSFSNYANYVRVSTDKDEQVSSVENQIDICRNWIKK
ncbi:hypothetical protein [Gottfriedia acidiceleris]|uniref:hypothetical protein n=1 Tax=Gottfriedia acidiceleris TaxID=371036 RepID=UPI00101D5353|nr:hypothetical protein [Gottfriedia acidiceleris]